MKNKIKKISFLFLLSGLILVLGGITYSFFIYTAFSNELVTNSGEVYMKLNKSNTNIILNKAFPETYEEALYVNGESGTLRTDNIIEFTVIGKNTYNNPVYYEIDLEYGDEVQNKTRINDKYLKFELLDITDSNNIEEIFSNESFNSIDNKKIYVENISNTDTNYSKTYRLRMWFDENIKISDTESNADFRASNNDVDLQNQDLPVYSDLFASVKVKVYGDFLEKSIYTKASCFTTSIINGNEIEITGYVGGSDCDTEVKVPKKIDGKSVTSIGSYAFYNNNTITSIELPNTVTVLKSNAISSLYNLTNLKLNDGLINLGNYSSIAYCRRLESLYIPKTVTSIHHSFLAGSGSDPVTTSITVSPSNPKYDSRNNCNGIVETATNTLVYANSLTVIDPTVTKLGDYLYSDDYFIFTLRNYVMPNNITELGEGVFCNCSNLESITFSNNLEVIGQRSFYNTGLTSVTLPPSVRRIEAYAFSGNRVLHTIDLNHGLEYIGDSAFRGDSALTQLDIPSSVTTLSMYILGDDHLSHIFVHWDEEGLSRLDVDYSVWNSFDVSSVTLIVPYDCVSLYQNNYYFRDFNIQEETED